MNDQERKRFRQMAWYGAKPRLKRILGIPGVNQIFRMSVAGIRPWMSKDVLSRMPVNEREIAAHAGDVHFRMLNPMRDSIAKELYWGRGERIHPQERTALELFCNLAKDCDVMFDIGANTGIFSLSAALANPRLEVHAYEIVPDVVEQLWRNLVANDVSSRVQIHAYGLGDPATQIRIPSQAGEAALPSALSSRTNFGGGTLVRFQSLDGQAVLVPDGSQVLFKVDIEGTEDALFHHGRRFLERYQPDILCEILPEVSNVKGVSEVLALSKYRFFKITDDALEEHAQLQPDVRYHDWLFTRRIDDDLASHVSLSSHSLLLR